MAFRDLLSGGGFVVTGEIAPPAVPDAAAVRAAATALAHVVHAANVTDNQAATVKMSPLAAAALMQESGLEPILQLTARDRNLLALQADLIGAWALGVRTVLALSGDPLSVGAYGGLAAEVRDIDSLGMVTLIAALNAGAMADGKTLESATDFLIAGAANPLVDSLERLEAKVAAGVRLLQTNIIYDVERFAQWFAPIVAAGIAERAPVLVGVTPPHSSRMLHRLHDRIPGVSVDEATFARMEGLAGDTAAAEGIQIAAEVVARVRELEGVAGAHIMTPGWDVDATARVVHAAGLEPPLSAASLE
jgi:methylenetetrahydrofolate reductase (NADPH)